VAQLIVRNLDDSTKLRLRKRARRHGRSMEEEVRDILRAAVQDESAPAGGLGTEISRLFSKVGLDADIQELRGFSVQPPSFEE
jgi:plasmid stability protein